MSNPCAEHWARPKRAWPPGRVLAVLLALAAAMRLFHLTCRGLWTDELTTLETIRLSFREIVFERMARGHFPTHSLLLKAWTALAGESEWALRLPSVILALLSIPFLYGIARRAWGERAAALAALFYLMNERMLWASQEARPYALVLLAAAASVHALVRALENAQGRWWALYAFWSLLGFVSHPTYAFVFVSQAVVVGGWLGRSGLRRGAQAPAGPQWRWDWAAWTGALLAAGMGALAILRHFQTNEEFFSPRRWPEWRVYRDALLELFWGKYDLLFGSGFKYAGLPLAAALAALAWRGQPKAMEPKAAETPPPARAPVFALSAAWAVSVLLGMALVSGFFVNVIKGPRYYAVGAGGAALLEGLAVASLPWRAARWAALAICLAIQAAVSTAWLYSPGEQAREAVRYIAARRDPNEPVILCHNANAEVLADYYGLGAKPFGLSRLVFDRAQVERFLDDSVGSSPGFWLLLYKEHDSPLLLVARRWTQGRYELAEQRDFHDARALRYRLAVLAPHLQNRPSETGDGRLSERAFAE